MNKKAQQEEIVIAVDKLMRKNQQLEKQASKLASDVELFEKRSAAEAILLSCRDVPSKYRTSGIDDFMSKRAELESKSLEELQKIADIVNILEVDDSTGLVQLVENVKNDDTPGTYDDWVINWRNENVYS